MILYDKKIILMLNFIMLVLPITAFASGDNMGYSQISKMSNTILNILSWFGYAIALRNTNMDRNKIYT